MKSASTKKAVYDVVISGGGLVGSLFALALARYGFTSLVVDRFDPRKTTAKSSDPRASAIAPDCWKLLNLLGLTNGLLSESCEITDMLVGNGLPKASDAGFELSLRNNRQLVVEGNDNHGQGFGYIVPNSSLRREMNKALSDCSKIYFSAENSITSFKVRQNQVCSSVDNGEKVYSGLLVSAEGRQSTLRSLAQIRSYSQDYAQQGIVCTIRHSIPHNGVAWQRFLPSGPLALLPLLDGVNGDHFSSLVWTEKTEVAMELEKMNDLDFAARLQRNFGDHLGELSVVGERLSYPIKAMVPDHLVADRFMLLGDSAHAIHPLAGQGLNLGIRDVAAATEALVDARRLGMDAGGIQTLERYQRWRRPHSAVALGLTDGLNRLFSNQNNSLDHVRGLGLSLVNQISPLKNFLAASAKGASNHQPCMLQGREVD